MIKRVGTGLLWFVLPVLPMWRETLPDGRTLPLRLVIADSAGRLLLLAVIAWCIVTGAWIGAVIALIFLMLLAVMRFGTSRLLAGMEPKQ
jgi:hypothetical protein